MKISFRRFGPWSFVKVMLFVYKMPKKKMNKNTQQRTAHGAGIIGEHDHKTQQDTQEAEDEERRRKTNKEKARERKRVTTQIVAQAITRAEARASIKRVRTKYGRRNSKTMAGRQMNDCRGGGTKW